MDMLPEEVQGRLTSQQNIWVASVRPDGRPHLTPVWYVWVSGKIYFCIDPTSVKARNLGTNQRVVVALEDGTKPVICEGIAREVSKAGQEDVQSEFQRKYEWDITKEKQYNSLIEITPHKWLYW